MNQPDPTQAWPVFVHPDMLQDLQACPPGGFQLRSHPTLAEGWMPLAYCEWLYSEPADYWPPLRFSAPPAPLRELVARIRVAHA